MARSSFLLPVGLMLLGLFSLCSSSILKTFGRAYEPATLPCNQSCSGTLTWTKVKKQDDTLVRCDSKSCQPKAGFELLHEEFLGGNLSLTVLSADYEDRGWYVCSCDSKPICDVSLILSAQEFYLEIDPGQTINLNLVLSDHVEVTFTGPEQNLSVCTVMHGQVDCGPQYTGRAAQLNTLQLKEGRISDEGLYTVRDIRNDEVISITRVHVKGGSDALDQSSKNPHSEDPCQAHSTALKWMGALLAIALVAVPVASLVVYLWLRKQLKEFQKRKPEEVGRLPTARTEETTAIQIQENTDCAEMMPCSTAEISSPVSPT